VQQLEERVLQRDLTQPIEAWSQTGASRAAAASASRTGDAASASSAQATAARHAGSAPSPWRTGVRERDHEAAVASAQTGARMREHRVLAPARRAPRLERVRVDAERARPHQRAVGLALRDRVARSAAPTVWPTSKGDERSQPR
jgi:hypothetical protein